MAVWVIMRALDALKLLPLPNRLDLMEALGLICRTGALG